MLKSEVMDYYKGKYTNAQEFVASLCGVSQPAVSKWEGRIPEKHAIWLHRHTRGRLRYDPGDYGRG